jgi:putative NIF3 family GTP cyclohydrolase 1 type 2
MGLEAGINMGLVHHNLLMSSWKIVANLLKTRLGKIAKNSMMKRRSIKD